MEKIVLKAQHRDVIGKQVKALRRMGRLPAVLYGRSIQPISVSFDFREANRILPGITSSHLIVIDVDGEEHPALVREKQFHPVQGKLVHVDFMVVSMTEKLRANVSIHLEGEAPALTDLNGVLVSGIEEIEVECLPSDLPERINVDISSLNEIGSAIYVRDLHLPSELRVLTEGDEMIVLITAQEAVEEEVVEKVEAEVEPEVIERGKKEEEEEF
jgi:large subunit ribosomal protein L25